MSNAVNDFLGFKRVR